ncbi:hypothetical protein EGW08_023641, partial [Elysia chlorotica]
GIKRTNQRLHKNAVPSIFRWSKTEIRRRNEVKTDLWKPFTEKTVVTTLVPTVVKTECEGTSNTPCLQQVRTSWAPHTKTTKPVLDKSFVGRNDTLGSYNMDEYMDSTNMGPYSTFLKDDSSIRVDEIDKSKVVPVKMFKASDVHALQLNLQEIRAHRYFCNDGAPVSEHGYVFAVEKKPQDKQRKPEIKLEVREFCGIRDQHLNSSSSEITVSDKNMSNYDQSSSRSSCHSSFGPVKPPGPR